MCKTDSTFSDLGSAITFEIYFLTKFISKNE